MAQTTQWLSAYWGVEQTHLVIQPAQDFYVSDDVFSLVYKLCTYIWDPHTTHKCNWPCLFHSPTTHSIPEEGEVVCLV